METKDFHFVDQSRLDVIEREETEKYILREAYNEAIRVLRLRERGGSRHEGGDGEMEIEQGDMEDKDEAHQMANELVATVTDDFGKEADRLAAELKKGICVMAPETLKEKESILEAGFRDWTKRDFKIFVDNLERFGRTDVNSIKRQVSFETGKDEARVLKYFNTFWERYTELTDWEKLIDRIESAERKTKRKKEIEEAIATKIAMYKDPARTLRLTYGSLKGRSYSDEEDCFLILMMKRHGFGAWEEICNEIRDAWQFRFNFFFVSRSPNDIAKRCDILVRVIERELIDPSMGETNSSNAKTAE